MNRISRPPCPATLRLFAARLAFGACLFLGGTIALSAEPSAPGAAPLANAAPKPLFRDPVFDGAADPVVVWNPAERAWWMFYTNRRANAPGLSGTAWVHGCRIGIAASADGAAPWRHVGTCDIELPADIGGAEPTHWAPDIVAGPDGTHHMFLTVVPGVFEDWNHPRTIAHLTSRDLRRWTYRSALKLASDRVIDACVHPLPGGGWRMWYNNERDGKSIYFADSPDLEKWTDRGRCAGVAGRCEGPYVFAWKGHYWMVVDTWRGLGVYRSDDLLQWTGQPEVLLAKPGVGADDGVNGGHAGIVVNEGRAFCFYFTHPGRAGTISPKDKNDPALRRSSIQVVELFERDGALTCDRDAPTRLLLRTPFSPSAKIDAGAAARILQRTKILASDAFEGRAPGTPGEEKTIATLVEEMRRLGLVPGNPDGTYIQEVPMIGVTSRTRATWTAPDGKARDLRPNVDIVAPSMQLRERVEVAGSEIVFLGYGVTAPEFGWDDYRGIDVRGKTVVVLVNDPPVTDPAAPDRLDPKVFGGKAMTYYGRWTYKYENAASHGAAACLIVHETGPAAYPFSVVVESRSRENFTLPPKGGAEAGRVAVEGWLSLPAATELLAASGFDFETLKRAAVRRDFVPVPLKARLSFSVSNTLREVRSKNAVGALRGADPARADQWIVYTSHWDHLGRDASLPGDQIYNGALDNASGVAQILEVAQGMLALPPERRPACSVLFLLTTSEEKNLLGAQHYADNPLYPLERTLADINVDCANPHVPTADIAVVGLGASTLDDTAADVARGQGRVIVPESHPEYGGYYRADHLAFARAGVPALYPGAGRRHIGKPESFAREIAGQYLEKRYHKVTDEVQPDWTMEGAALDAEFLLRVGLAVAADPRWPAWREGNEFKLRRDAMLGRR